MKKLKSKLIIIWRILFGQYNHFVILNISNKDLINLFERKDCAIDMEYIGLRSYPAHKLVHIVSSFKDDIDMELDRTQFEMEGLLFKIENETN